MTAPSNDGPSPKVSVLMLTFNHGPFIRQAVESALRQETNFPFEIVIGEDCSTDNTREVLRELDREHPGRLTLLLHLGRR
jgi:glycosyltransferase involved in cell wall biosynthesis